MAIKKSDVLAPKNQIIMGALLAGKSNAEAAELAGVRKEHVSRLVTGNGRHMCGNDSQFKTFSAEYERRLKEQAKRIMERDPDRSKEALLAELEEVRDNCKSGNRIDRNNWIKTIIERGKLLGYYIEKKEVSGAVSVNTPTYDFSAFSDSELEQFAALEAKATRPALGP